MPNTITISAPEEPHRKELNELLSQFESIDLKPYDWDSMLFATENFGASSLYELGDLFKDLNKLKSRLYLPQLQTVKIADFARQTLELFERSRAKEITEDQRTLIKESSNKLYQECFGDVSAAMVYCLARTFDPDGQRQAMKDLLDDLNKTSQDAEKLVQNVKESTQKVTVAQEAVHFRNQASRHQKASYGWLVATIVLAAITVYLAWVNFSFYNQLMMAQTNDQLHLFTAAHSIQIALAKLLLFSILLGGLIWCGRIYRAHRHNYVVNKHRQNALGTFNTFISSAQDQQTKNAVLLQATHCIFTPQASGYIPHEAESGGYPQILEIVKGAMTTSEK